MYHPDIIERRLHVVQQGLTFDLKRYSIGDSVDRQEALAGLWDSETNKLLRPLKAHEQEFIVNELTLSTHDFNYWLPRYVYVISPTGAFDRMTLWESQEIAMRHISEGELRAWKEMTDNLWDCAKARQLGLSQLFQALLCHRLSFYENQRGMIASYEPGPTHKLFRRFEIIYNNLPWWMKPEFKFWKKADEPGESVYFNKLNSSLYVGHGSKKGGGIGQGDSTNVFHFSEMPDWINYDQVEEDFLPSVHIHPTSFGARESTARRRGDHWHEWFKASWEGRSRFNAMFIPCYAEKTKYRMQPPQDWSPNATTLSYAKKVERTSPQYCFGETVHPTKGHLYWWEKTFTEFKEKGQLAKFFSEYAADHEEAFQHLTMGMFSGDLLMEMRNRLGDYTAYEIQFS